ncbi:hypothetical protein QQF64_026328 [Cirrhinus molitorella]|uniref:Uncharacterized protein n=1 Tax=Cirrhinus molitorella TaxID=172907 RepID=A0ABR3N999_9TELE
MINQYKNKICDVPELCSFSCCFLPAVSLFLFATESLLRMFLSGITCHVARGSADNWLVTAERKRHADSFATRRHAAFRPAVGRLRSCQSPSRPAQGRCEEDKMTEVQHLLHLFSISRARDL